MTLDEAIVHAREVAEEQKERCEQCAADHDQLAEWLEELKVLRESKADAIEECIRMVEEGVYRDCEMLAEQMRELKEQKHDKAE